MCHEAMISSNNVVFMWWEHKLERLAHVYFSWQFFNRISGLNFKKENNVCSKFMYICFGEPNLFHKSTQFLLGLGIMYWLWIQICFKVMLSIAFQFCFLIPKSGSWTFWAQYKYVTEGVYCSQWSIKEFFVWLQFKLVKQVKIYFTVRVNIFAPLRQKGL